MYGLGDGMKYFVCYARVSTLKQEHGKDAQLESARRYAESVGGEIIKVFAENASGKNDNREGLKAAIDHCKENDATLLIAKLDRLSRNAAFLHTLKDQLDKAGVEVIAADMPEVLSNTLMLSVMGGMAQHEREIISKRTIDGLKAAAEKGVKLGRRKGFHHSEETKAKIAASKMVGTANYDRTGMKYAIDKRKKGVTLQEIADDLNDILEVTTPTGKKFTPSQVAHMLKRAGN